MYLNPSIPFLMKDVDLKHLHERALRILEEIGVKVTEERLISKLKGKRGLKIEGDRVKFDPTIVAELFGLDEMQKEPLVTKPKCPESITVATSHHARYIVDIETGLNRLLTEADVIDMAKLSDALKDKGVMGGAPGAPQDIAPSLRCIAQYKLSLEWSRAGHYTPVSTVTEQRYVREMARVMGKEFPLECYLISPLRFEGDEVKTVLDYLETCSEDEKPVGVTVLSMPTMGLSAPVDPLAVFVLGIAENIGGYMILKSAFGDDIKPQIARANAYPCDFRTGGFIVGSPEAILIELIRRDCDRFYRHGTWARALRTMSFVPGIQAAAEKAAGAMACALAGYDCMFGGGLIGLDEIFSPVQLMIDCEIRDYVLQVTSGFEADENFDDVGVLRDILQASDGDLPFMTHPTTLDSFRKVFCEPKLFSRDMYKGQAEPKEDFLEKAREEIKQLIENHDYRLEKDELAEINKIYSRAEKDFI